jgi:hypothetical protein
VSRDRQATTWSCGYCLWRVEAGQSWRQCEACSIVLHAECWDDQGGCITLGCAHHPDEVARRAELFDDPGAAS